MQVCFLGLQAFSSLCQSVDFVNILAPHLRRPSGVYAFSASRTTMRLPSTRSTVTGRDASEEVISAIFANFCVGK